MRSLLALALSSTACLTCCEPNLVIGRDAAPSVEREGAWQPAGEGEWTTTEGSWADGGGGFGGGFTSTTGGAFSGSFVEECRSFKLDEDHEDGWIPVCCEAPAPVDAWRTQALFYINQKRSEQGAPDYVLDPALNEAAQAWAQHWLAHVDEPFAGNVIGVQEASETCGGVAVGFLLTDARTALRDDNLIHPIIPSNAWSSPDSNQARFFDATNVRIGIGMHQGLIVGMPGP